MVTWNRETDLLGQLVKNNLDVTSNYLFNYGITDVKGCEIFLRVNHRYLGYGGYVDGTVG